MAILIGVALVSSIGWLISLAYPRSAARRHLVLMTTLAACLLLPIAMRVRSTTDWTLLAIPTRSSERARSADATLPAMEASSMERNVSPQERDAGSSNTPGDQNTSGAANSDDGQNRSAQMPDVASRAASITESKAVQQADASPADGNLWRMRADNWGLTIYLAIAAIMLLRLFASLLWVRRMRRRAVEIDSLAGGIQVLEAEVAVPMALGFGRPAIVLPVGFRDSLQPGELRDVLAHEAEHLRRRDDWGLLLQRFVAAAYWPIVTIHLVNRALTRAREELCDNAVLAGRDPGAYGQTLLSLAERIIGRGRITNQLALSIIGRGELERRVAALLDKRRDRRTHVRPRARWTLAASLLALAMLMATTRLLAVADTTPPTESATNEAKSDTPAPKPVITWTGIPKVDLNDPTLHRGVVLAPDGKPLAGASVYAASTIELQMADSRKLGVKDLGPVRAVTDAEGRFEFKAKDLTSVTPAGKTLRWETLLVAIHKDIAPGWLETWGDDRSFRDHWDPDQSADVAIHTRTPATLTGRLLLEDGGPLAGARVRLTGLNAPVGYDLDRHLREEEHEALGLFATIDYAESLYPACVVPGLNTEATTNKEGQFELPGLPEGFIAGIEIAHPRAVSTGMRVAVRAIEPVRRKKPFGEELEPTPTLYGSGFTATLPKGMVLKGRAIIGTGFGFAGRDPAPGVTVAPANQNARDGMEGQRFKTDAEGRFEVTGLMNSPGGWDVAFAGGFHAPFASHRQRIVPGEDARVVLQPTIPYRLKLTDPAGKPVNRRVYSILVQRDPGDGRIDAKSPFNDAEQVAPGVYEGIVPIGAAAVVVERGAKSDRPAAVDPKAFFAPGRTDWTLEEERLAYGDAWRIAQIGGMPLSQLDLAAAVFTNTREDAGVQELSATVYSDPPVNVTLVDEAGAPVENARVERQLTRYNAEGLPATFAVYALHPQRAEFLRFVQEDRGLIGVLSTTWTADPVRVVMQPAGKLLGRFVDKSGKLNFDFGARVTGRGVMPETLVAGRMYQTTKKRGEQSGEFELLVPPGLEVQGQFVRKNAWVTRPTVGIAFGPLTAKPGETIDLGDITVP